MLFTPLVSAGIEKVLNAVLYRDQALKAARQRVQGKVLWLSVPEFNTPLVLAFAAQQVDVLNHWQGEADARVTTRLTVLAKLRDRQQLAGLIRSGDVTVQGDIQVVQNVVALLDLAGGDLAHWLSYGLGDVGGQAASQVLCATAGWFKRGVLSAKYSLTQALTTEWQLAPAAAQVRGFVDDTTRLAGDVDALTKRLDKLEAQ